MRIAVHAVISVGRVATRQKSRRKPSTGLQRLSSKTEVPAELSFVTVAKRVFMGSPAPARFARPV